MTVEQMTARINELYHKSKKEGLTEAEKEEQGRLRQAYVANVRANLRGQLDNISIVEKDGTVTNLRDKKKAQSLSKEEVRRTSLQRRDDLPAQERTRYSREIMKNMTSRACYQEADALLVYASYRSEVDTFELMKQALLEKKLVFVPRVEGRDMEFYRITDLSDLQEGYRGILEPKAGRSYPEYLLQTTHVLMCLPGAAFDRAHHRIGYGGGFYDRYLEKLGSSKDLGKIQLTTAALAYQCQVWEQIPWESHDMTPDMILTEQGCL